MVSELKNWCEISQGYESGSILVGNGLSRSLYSAFDYGSLIDAAKKNTENPLSCDDLKLFTKFATSNFEEVLGRLLVTQHVLSAIAPSCAALSRVEEGYERIRDSLIEAVHDVHIDRGEISNNVALKIGEALSYHSLVFTTNYDLITYWSLMHWATVNDVLRHNRIRDHFRNIDPETKWDHIFELADALGNAGNACETEFLFLHGALHLFRSPNGRVGKVKYNGQQILSQFYDYPVDDSLPLFISEGDAVDKRRTIHNSSYLSFVFARLEEDANPLVIFGHSLSNKDEHIREAIGDGRDRRIAISIRAADEDKASKRMAEYTSYFPLSKPQFFRADTHPLGSVGTSES